MDLQGRRKGFVTSRSIVSFVFLLQVFGYVSIVTFFQVHHTIFLDAG
jgi:hypothetical protein